MVLNVSGKWFRNDELYLVNDQVEGYTIKKLLGEGRYGIAYLAQNGKGQQVVIKQLKARMLKKARSRIKYEQDTLKQLGKVGDARFPKYIGKFNDGKREGYILEYKVGRTFEQIIYEDHHVFSREEIYEIAFHLLAIIKILFENNIIHKDIRVANVVMHNTQGIALIDFGLARYIDHKKYKVTEDYWYLADFLIHLYYTSFKEKRVIQSAWYKELDLTDQERSFLRKLMGLEGKYQSIDQIEEDLLMLVVSCF